MRRRTDAPSPRRLTHLATANDSQVLPSPGSRSKSRPAVHPITIAALLRHLRPEPRPCRPVPGAREPHLRQHDRRGTLTLKLPLALALSGIPLRLPVPLSVSPAKQDPSQLWAHLRIRHPQKVASRPSRHASHHRHGVRRG